MPMIGPEGLDEFADECASALIVDSPTKFFYPDDCNFTNWPIDEIKQLNDETLKSLRGAGNVYAIYTRRVGESWSAVYVGQRKSTGLRERITQHLINKDVRTGSMLEAVKTAISDGREMAISFIQVQPESLRLYVEETIISKNKAQLPWNTHG
ncbi:GIY-YIG nuclease family protein [Teredinibacter purpureus]|uniref:GIY-YIG nuclease family protein n=1 Tax=Teredinibacter purpureus TaxID=2731756 RepID=UPI0005F7A8DC|nr:GIY-YIG nuclease family protein [Teredinibacter purpureus]